MDFLRTWVENRVISVVRIQSLIKLVAKSWARNFQGFFFTFILPTIFLLVTVELTRNKLPIFASIIPGLLAQTAISIGLISSNNLILSYKESVVIKRIGITPLPKTSFIIAIVLFSSVLTVISGAYIFGFTELIYGTTNTFAGVAGMGRENLEQALPQSVGGVFLFLLGYLTIIVMSSSFVLVIAAVSKNLPTALSIAFIIYFPSLFLIGTSIPYDFVITSGSSPLIWISYFIPFRYGAEMLTLGWNDVNYFQTAAIATNTINNVRGGVVNQITSAYFFRTILDTDGSTLFTPAAVPLFCVPIIAWGSIGITLTGAKILWKWEV